MKLKYKQKGMTLVEVLIAGIILFISISTISLVARTKLLNEQRLAKAIEYAYLAEYSIDAIKYHLEYTNTRKGEFSIGKGNYLWHASIADSKAPMRTLNSSEPTNASPTDILKLYKVTITSANNKDKAIYEYFDLIWEIV